MKSYPPHIYTVGRKLKHSPPVLKYEAPTTMRGVPELQPVIENINTLQRYKEAAKAHQRVLDSVYSALAVPACFILPRDDYHEDYLHGSGRTIVTPKAKPVTLLPENEAS